MSIVTRSNQLLEVIMPGSPVLVGNGKIDAKVVRVCIGDKNNITYECAWWDGNQRHEEWLHQAEVLRTDATAAVKIGFCS